MPIGIEVFQEHDVNYILCACLYSFLQCAHGLFKTLCNV